MKKWASILIAIFIVCISFVASSQEAKKFFFSNFTSGSLTPKLNARIDFEKYSNGAKTIENMIVYPYGGVVKRPGTYYVSGVSDNTQAVRLIPFTFSTEQSYMIEMGPQYARFYMEYGLVQGSGASTVDSFTKLLLHFDGSKASTVFADDGITGHTVTANGSAQLDTDYKKFGTASGLFNPYISVPDHADWDFSNNPFTIDFWVRYTGTQWYGYIHDTDANNAAKCNFSVNNLNFRVFVSGASEVDLNYGSLTSDTWHHIAIIRGWGGSANSWALCINGIAQDTETSSVVYPNFTQDFEIGNLSDGHHVDEFRVSKGTARWTANFTPPASPYPQAGGGVGTYEIATPFLEEHLSQLKYVQSADYLYFAHPEYPPWKLTRTGHAAWSGTNISFTPPLFGGVTGYPTSVEFHEERLCFAGTTVYPQTIWMSKSGDYENFTLGSNDDDGIEATISASQINAIQWMNSGDILAIGTTGGEWRMGAPGQDSPITPSNIQLKRQTNFGSANIQPVRVGKDLFFIERGNQKLRNFHYSYDADSYISSDITLLAEHLTSGVSEIVQLVYQQGENPVIWSLLNNGDLLGLTYLPEHNVMAWHKHTTNGVIESIAVIPDEDNNDELWWSVARSSGASRFIEYMADIKQDDINDTYYVDCGKSLLNIGNQSSVFGFTYLTGLSVQVVANGAPRGFEQTVPLNGQIYLPYSTDHTQIGLGYIAKIETIDIPVNSWGLKRVDEVVARLYKTCQFKWGHEASDLYEFVFDSGVTPYTGDIELNMIGDYKREHNILFQSDEPLPFSLSGVYLRYE